MKIIQKTKNFLIDPHSAFDKEKKTKMGEAFKYTLVLSLVTSIISAIINLSFNSILAIQGFFATYLGIFFLNIIWWLWLHLISYTAGVRKRIEQILEGFGGMSGIWMNNVPTKEEVDEWSIEAVMRGECGVVAY